MPTKNSSLKDSLSKGREITLTVTGRKSGRQISIPVWFVLAGNELLLLPVNGSDTQWYKNILKHPSLRVAAHGAEAELGVKRVVDPTRVSSVIDQFREKYGAGDMKKYYTKFDAAVTAELT